MVRALLTVLRPSNWSSAQLGLKIARIAMQHANDGRVTDWGPPNSTSLVEGWVVVEGPACLSPHPFIQQVPCWKVLHVDIYVLRDGPQLQPGDSGWGHYVSYVVHDWEDVRPIFDRCFGTGGLYNRVRFSVESWLWTAEAGWECDDQL